MSCCAATRARPVPSRAGLLPERLSKGREAARAAPGGRCFLPARETRAPLATDPRQRGPGASPARYGRRSGQCMGGAAGVRRLGLRGAPAGSGPGRGKGAVGSHGRRRGRAVAPTGHQLPGESPKTRSSGETIRAWG